MEGDSSAGGGILADEHAVDCSVLVPVYNEERHIVASLGSMRAQRFEGELEFLLADGGSTDRTRELVEQLAAEDPRIRILDNPRRSIPSGLNVALRHARGRCVARMDAHTEYPPDYVALGVARLRQGGTQWVSGPAIPVGQGPVSRAVALALGTWLGQGGSRKWKAIEGGGEEFELDSGVFAGVWHRETVLEYGGWDEGWPRNQDSEMAGRFMARGERLICLPGMAARYVPRDTLDGLWRQYQGYGRFRRRTAARHPHTMRRSHLIAPALVATMVAGAIPAGRLPRLARAGLKAYAIALLAAAAQAARVAEEPVDAALVPVVLLVMHVAYGTGAWSDATRHGLPLAALARAAGLRSLAERLLPAPSEVFAPSLGTGARA